MGGVQPVEDCPSGRLGGDDALAAQPVQTELNAGRRAVVEQGVNLAAGERGLGATEDLQDPPIDAVSDQIERMSQVHDAHNSRHMPNYVVIWPSRWMSLKTPAEIVARSIAERAGSEVCICGTWCGGEDLNLHGDFPH